MRPEPYIYLDHNAFSPLRPQAKDKMLEILEIGANPSSVHRPGKYVREQMDLARRTLGSFIDAYPEDIIFTSGGTESNNMALRSEVWDTILISATEHESVYKAASNPWIVSVWENGLLDLEELEHLLKKVSNPEKTLLSIHWANNETGVIQPLEEIVVLAQKYKVTLHVDAVQVLGKIPFSFKKSGVHMMSLSAHKVGGPQGSGALVVQENVTLAPLLKGGGQEKFRRAGTENVAGIVGFGEALNHVDFSLQDTLKTWHSRLEKALKSQGGEVFGDTAPRLSNTTSISMACVPSHTQLINFDLAGIAVSAGAACSSGKITASRIIQQMGYSKEMAETTIRISSGWNTSEDDLILFQETWKAMQVTI
jgi:cysteine desulfurase